jgi:hypothetical protein
MCSSREDSAETAPLPGHPAGLTSRKMSSFEDCSISTMQRLPAPPSSVAATAGQEPQAGARPCPLMAGRAQQRITRAVMIWDGPRPAFRRLVTGSPTWTDVEAVCRALDELTFEGRLHPTTTN